MLILLSLGVFSLVLGVSTSLATRFWLRPRAALDRLKVAPAPAAAPRESSPSTVHRLLRRLGETFRTVKSKDRLRLDFIQAGIRHGHAQAVFNGMQVIAALAASMLVAAITIARRAESATVVMCVLGAVFAGSKLPGELLRMRVKRRRQSIRKALPNALDLLTVGVEAGLGLDQAIVNVSQELAFAHPEISEEFAMINFETRAGKRRADALRSLAERTGVLEVKKLAAVLIQADRFGTSVAQSLRAHSEHLRVQSRQAAEEKAAKLGVKLVFPIFFFILPSLFVVTVGPVIVRIFQELLPLMNSL